MTNKMTDNSEAQQIRDLVDGLLVTRHDELYDTVRKYVADVLAINPAKVTPDASLIDDLGAESLDFLDLVFQLETAYGVKIPRDGIRLVAREGLGDGFEHGGVLTGPALERLRLLMPEVQATRIAPGLSTHQIANLFTVETFVRLVAWRLADGGVGPHRRTPSGATPDSGQG